MASTAASSRSVEDRIRAIEDRLEILNLIASHPPSADTGADYYTRAAYLPDGELDLGRGKATAGNETIAAVTRTPAHQAAIAGGLAHFAGLPRIELDGDRAVVDVLSADPHAASDRSAPRGPQPRRLAGLPHPPRRRQPLGAGAHRRRLENPAPHRPHARRHRARPRNPARRAAILRAEELAYDRLDLIGFAASARHLSHRERSDREAIRVRDY